MPRSISSAARRLAGPIAVAVALLGVGAVAAAETPEELREQRRKVQEEAAEAAAEVEAADADWQVLTEALEALQASVDAQQAALDAASRGVVEAEAAQSAAEQAVVELEDRKAVLEAQLREAAVESFVSFQAPAGNVDPLGDDPVRQARNEALVEFATGTRLDGIDELRSVGAELEQQRTRAEEAAAAAEALQAEVQTRLTELEESRRRQAELVVEAEERLDARLAEAAALEALDAQLAAEIVAEERRIAEEIAARTRAASTGGGGTGTIPDNAPVDLTTVRGFVVNVAIADQVEGLLAAMAAEGFPLGGGGYRSNQRQIELRSQHCGTSDYAIWEMPASQCGPPTARPGRSAHERGLAIDFTHNGSIIRSRSSAVFQALQRIAPDYGFRNLPSEPWHWSTDGT